MSVQAPSWQDFCMRCLVLCEPAQSKCFFGHVIRAIWCENLQEKWRAPGPRDSFCVSLCDRNAHGHVTRAILCRNFQGKCNAATATPVSCEPAQCHKRHFVWKFSGKMLDATAATTVLCEPVLSKCTWTLHKSHFAWTFIGKMMAVDTSGDIVLGEPAQSKCTWTRALFVWKFTGNMPNSTDTTSIEHRALTLTVRTPQCGHSVWGNIVTRTLRAEEG